MPGLGCRPEYYRSGIERLADRFTVVIPDLSFRTHRDLPESPRDYLELLTALGRDLAPDAVWVGHSFGALVALMREGPAIACAPSVPAPISLPRYVARAARLQLGEWIGLEGWAGVRYAGRVLVDYLRAAALQPDALFPSVRSIRAPAERWPPSGAEGVVYLSRRDEMYRRVEYDRYFAAPSASGLEIETIPDRHDWPITRPDRFARRVAGAYDRLRPGVRAGSVGA